MSSLFMHMLRSPWRAIVHPSPWRIRAIGLAFLLSHPLLAWLWSEILRQPYESLTLRGVMMGLGALLMAQWVCERPHSRLTQWVYTLVCWVQLPLFTTWMYLHNPNSLIWLAQLCAVVLIYHQLTDWRIATLGTALGGIVAFAAMHFLGTSNMPWPQVHGAEHAEIILLVWFSAVVLSWSYARQRLNEFNTALMTTGLMAHELRLSVNAMEKIAQRIQTAVTPPESSGIPPHKASKLAHRLLILIDRLQQKISTQISNARLLEISKDRQTLSAQKIVQEVVENYPYRSSQERLSVQVDIRDDFLFQADARVFEQTLHNILKNGLTSLAAANSAPQNGDIRITVAKQEKKGRIVILDHGIGMSQEMLHCIFEPFFSSDENARHGLGLAFSQRAVQYNARGTLTTQSKPTRGAVFIIELALLDPASP